ncbi:homocysteine S-methyltransferase [Philodulcilactobacillus myokoensis]|nr:homocysteine S-methyltransferase [Philodulcilactobacillus myokoensis]
MSNFTKWVKQQKHVLLDSSMSLGLEERGLNLDSRLWTADALKKHSNLITDVHKSYFDSGSNLTTLDTYQASIPGLIKAGYSEQEAVELLKKAVEVAKKGRKQSQTNQPKWLAAGIGPYGAYLANGAEYTGDYELSDKQYVDFHKERIQVLINAGIDVLMLETMPKFKEIKAVVNYLANANIPVIVSCSLLDANHISDGTPIMVVQNFLEQKPYVIAYGINCVDPELVTPALKNLTTNVSNHKDLIVFPNLGAAYNPKIKKWTDDGISEHDFNHLAKQWLRLGVKYVGGCCCMSEKRTRSLGRVLQQTI